jgi:hypothetical protein
MSVGGGASPEFEKRWSETIANYLTDPSCANAVLVRSLARDFYMIRPNIASIGPLLGMLDAVDEKHPKVHGRNLYRVYKWVLRRLLPAWRPGWNDYWMMRWQLTHSDAAACEIHRRAWHSFMASDMLRPLPQEELERLHAAWESARWMVGSYRRQDPAFQVAMLEIEKNCGLCSGLHGDADLEGRS